ncbi:MAG: hypothetical protein K0Q74_1641, partial [Gammaproteobacteria bacterium]|nr:hypothetical protein [Gammaproteobacteria bacterium]
MLESQIENRTDIPDPKGARVSKPFWVMPTMRILGLVSLVASFYFPLAILPAVFFLAKDFQEGLSRARELWIKRERFLAVGVFLTTFLPASLVITVFFSLLFQFSPLLNLPLLAIAAGVFIISSNLVRGLFLLQSNEWRKYGGFGENDELSWKNLILLSFALVFGLGSLKQASAPKKRAFIGLGALAVLMAISGSVSLILYAITVFTSANLSFLVGIGTTLGLSGPLAIAMPVILTGIVLGFIIGAIAAIVWDASIKKQPSIQQNARKEYDQSPSSKQESEDQRIFALLDNKDPLQKEELEKILNLFKEKPIYFQTVHFFPEGRGRKLFLKVIETRDREALSFLLNNFLGAKENYTVREQTLCKFLMEQLFTAEKEGKSDVSDFLFEWFNKKCGNSGKNIMWDNVLLRMDKKKPYIIQLLLRHPDIQPPSDTVHGRTSEYLIPALIHAVASNQKDFAQYLVEKCAVDIEAAIKQVPNEELLVVTRLRYLAKNLKSQQPNVVAAGHPAAASPEQSHLPPFSSDEKLERLVGATHGAQKLGLSKPSQSQPSKQRSTNEDVKYPQNTNQQPLHHSAYNSHQSQRSSQLLAYKPVSFSNSALPKTDSKNEEDHQNKKTNPKPVVPKTDDEVILDLLKKESPLEKEELEKILELLKAEPAYLRSMNLYPEGRKLLAKVIEIQDKSVLDFLLKGLPLKQNYMVGEERTYVFLANELFSAEKTGRYDISDTLLTWFSKCREVGKDIMWKKAILRMNHGQLHITKLLLRHPHIQPPLKY